MSFSTTERPPLPKSYMLGEGPKFVDFKLEGISHKNAEFTLQTNEVQIKLKSPLPLKKTTQLIQIMGPSEEKILADNVWMEKDGDIYSFIVTFPNPGWYKFEIYALPASSENPVLPGVFNYLIHVLKAPNIVLPFPKQFSPWKIGCHLFTPLTVDPSHLENLYFKVLVPTAKSVAIVINDVFTNLEKTGRDLWEAHVNLDVHRNSSFKLNLCACLDESETVYSTLLQYSMYVDDAHAFKGLFTGLLAHWWSSSGLEPEVQFKEDRWEDIFNSKQAHHPELSSGYVLGKGPKFTEMHLECISHHSPEFTLQTNEVEITFRSQYPLKKSVTLSELYGRNEKVLGADKVWIETEGNIIKFRISFPDVGWYKFEIFALPFNDPNTFLPMVYSYLIYVEATPKPVVSYPQQFAPWTDDCHLYSPLALNPSYLKDVPFKVKVPNARYVAVVLDGHLEMLVRTSEDIWVGYVSLDKPNLRKIAVSANMMNDDESIYKSLLQFAVPPTSVLNSLQHSAASNSSSIRDAAGGVVSPKNTMQAQRPTLPSGYVLGKGSRFSEMQLECISHHSPEFTLQTNEVEITFRCQFPLKRSATLSQVSGKDEEVLEADTFWIESEGNIIKFLINFPKVGWYKFEIFALTLNDANTFLPMVYSYLIYVEATPKPVFSYPHQYASWNDNCHLYSPLTLNPSHLRDVPFKVKVPNARYVAVVVEAFWKMLVRANGDIWEGRVSLDKPNLKKITLSANMMNDDESTYTSLLQFTVPPTSGLTGFQQSAAAAAASSSSR